MSYRDAQSIASVRSLDLVSVNHVDGVEVFKIMDYGKWKYDKKKNKQKKPHHSFKEMNFKLRIDIHDQNIKIERIKGFLNKGDDVKISIQLRGREKSNPDQATDKLEEILASLENLIQIQHRKTTPSMAFAIVRAIKKSKKKEEENENTENNIPRIRSDGNGNSNTRKNSQEATKNKSIGTSIESKRKVNI